MDINIRKLWRTTSGLIAMIIAGDDNKYHVRYVIDEGCQLFGRSLDDVIGSVQISYLSKDLIRDRINQPTDPFYGQCCYAGYTSRGADDGSMVDLIAEVDDRSHDVCGRPPMNREKYVVATNFVNVVQMFDAQLTTAGGEVACTDFSYIKRALENSGVGDRLHNFIRAMEMAGIFQKNTAIKEAMDRAADQARRLRDGEELEPFDQE